MLHKCLTLLILTSQIVLGKIEFSNLKGIDILKDHPHLNPGHGVAFTESGLLENIGELSVETKTQKEPDYLKKARKLINILFHRMPSGFLPSSGANKVSFYLHPELIGILLKETIDPPQKKRGENRQESLKNKLIEIIMNDQKVKEKIELSKLQYCNFDNEIRAIEEDTKSPYSEEVIEQLSKLKRSRKFNQVFKNPEDHYCQDLEVKKDEKIDYKNLTLKSDLNAISSALSFGKNLLITRAMLALLWHKVETKKGFASYLKQIEGKEVELTEDRWTEDDFNEELDLEKPALTYFYSFYVNSKKMKINLLQQKYSYINEKDSKNSISFPDCGATSLRNFIRLLSFDGKKYDVSKLKEIGASEEVIEYFKKYSDHKLQASQEARNDWASITCNKNVENPEKVYLTKTEHNYCEINAGAHNMLKIMQETLFANAENKPEDWDDVGKSMTQQNKSILISEPELYDNLGEIDFEIDDHMHKYRWNFSHNHFYIEEIIATKNNNQQRFNEIIESKSKHLNNLGNTYNSPELSWIEYAATLNFPNKNDRIINLEKIPNERMFFLNTNSDEKIISVVNRLSHDQTGLIKTLVHKLRDNGDSVRRLVIKTINDTQKLNYIFSILKNKSIGLSYIIENPTLRIKLAEALGMNNTLTTLNISHNNLGEKAGIQFAKSLENNKTLTTLYFSHNNLGEKAGIQFAKSLENNKTLTTLYFGYNQLGEKAGVQFAKSLENNKTLTTLHIGNNNLGEKAGVQFAKSLENNETLTTLYISCNNLCKKTGIQFAKSLENNKTLTTLYIGFNYLGEKAGIQFAKALKKNNTLTTLYIRNNNLGEKAGIQFAKALKKNNTLTYLNISTNNLSEKTNERLRQIARKRENLQISAY